MIYDLLSISVAGHFPDESILADNVFARNAYLDSAAYETELSR